MRVLRILTHLCHSTINFAVMHKSALAHGVVIYRDANWARDLPTQKGGSLPCPFRQWAISGLALRSSMTGPGLLVASLGCRRLIAAAPCVPSAWMTANS